MMSRAKAIGYAAAAIGKEISTIEDNLYRANLQIHRSAPSSPAYMSAADYAAQLEERLIELKEVLHILGEIQGIV